MRWMEIIRFRAAGKPKMMGSSDLSELINDILKMHQTDLAVYASPLFKGDLCIQIFWEEEEIINQGSRAGTSLAEALKMYGLVEHSVWIGIENGKGVFR